MICRKKGGKKAFVKTPLLSSISKLIERVNDWASYKDSAVTNLAERAKKRYSDSIEYGDSSVVKRKAGRPSMISFPNIQEETLTTRSKSSFFDKALCTVCQCPGGVLNRVEATGDNLFHLNFQTRHSFVVRTRYQ